METPKENLSKLGPRLDFLITRVLSISKTQFAKNCGMISQDIQRLSSETNDSITRRLTKRITDAYPDLNLNWLFNGVGDVFIGGMRDNAHNVNNGEVIKKLLREDKLSATKIAKFTDRSRNWVYDQEKKEELHNDMRKAINRFYPMYWSIIAPQQDHLVQVSTVSAARTPVVPLWGQKQYLTSKTKKSATKGFPGYTEYDFGEGEFLAFEIAGDANEPKIVNGDIVLCKNLDKKHWEQLLPNKLYMIAHVKLGFLFAILKEQDDQRLVLTHFNSYVSDREIILPEIKEIWHYKELKTKRSVGMYKEG